MADPADQYKQVQINTATQEQLILLMYDHAIKSIHLAKDAIEPKKYDIVSNNVIKAQDIVTELMVSLKMEVGPVSQNLYRLYDYLNRRLIEGNMKKSAVILQEVADMMTELRKTWETAFNSKSEAEGEQSAGDTAADKDKKGPDGPPQGGFSVSG